VVKRDVWPPSALVKFAALLS